ncbi:RagB/SusD family nutrient uptake outer membrane protein [Aquimarina sp. AD10]|uniref:RagB/SusD family nutrient uptake outer membrane protein n=1 Tax=Aquimarina TaxID=290174 RepID=UPI000E514D8E|nr:MULTISPECIES: RagB/SusD family nutrient uptake outer membrane protein [Aquimarina]AXT60516.1 RagB/SusD family nutrient uptake outer membrane protein [Aquimarina sp. AD10]RKM97002.1 RagB/SusD family nutrient uptake outer membrane protein [Aquimarina sp. AD10]
MKKIVIILSLISIVAVITGCSQDEFLNVENRNSLNAENFWQNQRDAESGIFSVYSSLQFTGVLGGTSVTNFALLSEASRTGNIGFSAETLEIDNAIINSANPRFFDMWEDLYRVVFRANQVIKNVPGIEMDETAKREILGEAYFLRGLAMFWLGTTFNQGDVPLPLIPAASLEESRLSISPKAQVFEQIFSDLQLAQNNLRDRLNWTGEGQEGRATWGAATAILGKVYLYEENFSRAREEFLKVINSNEYSLTANIEDNFTEAGEFNSESIFEVQFFANLENNGNFGDGEGSQPNESTLRGTSWVRGNGGFGAVFATHFISSLYRNEVIDPNLPINQAPVTVYDDESNPSEEARKFSTRSEASIAYEGDGSLFYGTSTREGFIRVVSRAHIKKNTHYFENREPRNSGINERIIRLADVYLMYAEAVLREQGDAGITEALTYINQVRQRSGLITLEALFEGVGTPPILRNTFPDLTDAEILALVPDVHPSLMIERQDLTADNIIIHLFNKERPAEFAWEGRGILWHDLRRRPDGGANRIRELGEIRYTTTTLDVQNFELLEEFVDNSLQDFRDRKVNFTEDDYFFPIPAQEILQNPNINN